MLGLKEQGNRLKLSQYTAITAPGQKPAGGYTGAHAGIHTRSAARIKPLLVTAMDLLCWQLQAIQPSAHLTFDLSRPLPFHDEQYSVAFEAAL